MSLKLRITDDMKAAMRAGEKDRLGVISRGHPDLHAHPAFG